jgi:hypothetical protein
VCVGLDWNARNREAPALSRLLAEAFFQAPRENELDQVRQIDRIIPFNVLLHHFIDFAMQARLR